jgi:hypothetical protein
MVHPWTGTLKRKAEEGKQDDTGPRKVIQWTSKAWTAFELKLPVFYRESLARLLALERYRNLIETNITAGMLEIAGCMAQDNGWTVQKALKSVLVVGTPLCLIWTEEHQKLFPKCTFEGNVRIAIVQAVANGYNFLVFKDNSFQKISICDMQQVVTVSNNILANRQVGHTRAKAAAVQEPLCPAFDPDAGSSDDSDEDDPEEEDASENENDSGKEEEVQKGDGGTGSTLMFNAATACTLVNCSRRQSEHSTLQQHHSGD